MSGSLAFFLTLFLVLLLFSSFVTGGEYDLTAEVPPGKIQCFFQPVLEKHKSMEVYYQVIDGGDLNINFMLILDANVLKQDQMRTDGDHKIDIPAPADYQLCFDNSFSYQTRKVVFFVTFLVENGANLDLGSDSAITPLMIACDRSQTEIVAFAIGQRTYSSSSAAASSPVPFHHRKQAKDTHQQPAQPLTDHGTGNFFLSAYATSEQRIASDSEWKKTPIGQTGLYNMGNTCFMNSALQPLFHTPGFSQLFQEKSAQRFVNGNNSFGTNGVISGSFSALIDLIWSGKFNALRPGIFLEFFARRVNTEMADRQQHDAQEFQLYLLDALHEDTNRVNKRQSFEQNYDDTDLGASASDFNERSKLFSSSPVNDLFNLTNISVVQCSTCNTKSVRFEVVNQLSLELPTNTDCLTLKDCLEAHFSSASLEDKWDCPKCKSKQPATRSTKIWEIPKVLIVHLKRFSLIDGHYVKNDVEVTFDVAELDLAPFLHEKSTHHNAALSLYGITDHSGRLNSGHYTSSVINLISTDREWLSFDDESCIPCGTAPSPTSKRAFLLYYKQNDQQQQQQM